MFQQDFSKGILLLMELPLHFSRKSNSHIWMSVFLNSLICPLPYILILRHSHTVLITVASVSWKSSNFAILCLKFLNTQGPLHFHKILESTDQFLPKKKNSTAIFIGIESYLNISYELFIFQQCWSFQSMNKASLYAYLIKMSYELSLPVFHLKEFT